MRYEEFDPLPALAGWVCCYWAFSASGAASPFLHTIPPDGCVSIVFLRSLRICRLIGPTATALRRTVAPASEFWGVRFQPGAGGALLGIRAPELRDRTLPLGDALPELALELAHALDAAPSAEHAAAVFEGVVERLSGRTAPPDASLVRAIRMLVDSSGTAPLRAAANAAGLRERQFRRRFTEAVGLTPKEFARIRRSRAAAVQLVEEPEAALAGVAAESGYADQSHLTREFVSIYGQTPTSVAERLRRIQHHNVR